MVIPVDELNNEQTEAVSIVDSPLLIIAGAGSGKTRVLTFKIAFLVNKCNIHPSNILGVTFTNKAADEMKTRVMELTGIDGKLFNISTFHSLGLKILRQSGGDFGYGGRWQVGDDREQKKIITEIVKKDYDGYTNEMIDHIVRRINRAKMKLIYPNNPESLKKAGFSSDEISIFNKYFEYQKEFKVWDFEDLVSLPAMLLGSNDKLKKFYNEKFKYVLVDEFQDTNPNQYALVKQIASSHGNITVVGDDDQAIYSWRGADIRSISDFENDFPGTRTIKLERNYRSTPSILNFANSLIRRNRFRKKKIMWTERESGDPVVLLFSGSKENEADQIRDLISRLPDDPDIFPVAILYRVNSQSLILETALQSGGIDYKVLKGQRFFDRKEVKDAISLLRLTFDHSDNLAFSRIIDFLPLGIGRKGIDLIEKRSNETGRSLFITLKEDFNEKFNSRPLFGKIVEMRDKFGKKPPSEILRELLNESGYLDYLEKKKEEERILNVNELLEFIEKWESDPGYSGDLSELFDKLTIESGNRKEGNRAKVLLLTMHNSKGLEFPTVIIAGANSTYMPFFLRKKSHETEEERRLFYVAATRAIDRLIISSGGPKESKFISEASFKNVELTYNSVEIINTLFNAGNQGGGSIEDHESEYRKVLHPVFGEGVISQDLGEGKLLIKFMESGEKIIDTGIIDLKFE